MKKSPLSMPRHSPVAEGSLWKPKNYNLNSSPFQNHERHGDDFIPLNISTPNNKQRRYSNNYQGSPYNYQGSPNNYQRSPNNYQGSPNNYQGSPNKYHSSPNNFYGYRNNRDNTPRSHYHSKQKQSSNTFYPQKNTGRNNYGPKRNFQKGSHRTVNISRYVNIKSFLEDPWADLISKLNAKFANKKTESLHKSQEYREFGISSQESESDTSQLGSTLTNTECSELSKASSSVDLEIDGIKFSPDLKKSCLSSTIEEKILLKVESVTEGI
ncbi:probable serine/threonine-protein kinase clkA [Prorops nasuta]|uniref:probable serine/threonine-protein kinase clkA n=1 Tax=Prorops nasuta TaxID=863751 RepID=UPI0034CEA616